MGSALFLVGILVHWILTSKNCETVQSGSNEIFPRELFLKPTLSDMYSADEGVIRECLWELHARKDMRGISRAIELLEHPDDYVWLNAALYLGAMGRSESVPYLIKALRHTAARSDIDTIRYLRALTKQDMADFEQWRQWWTATHPDFRIQWETHLGERPRFTEIIDSRKSGNGVENGSSDKNEIDSIPK